MTVGKATKIFVSVLILSVLLNAVYFAFIANVWLGVGAVIATVGIGYLLYKFIKKPLTGGRFW